MALRLSTEDALQDAIASVRLAGLRLDAVQIDTICHYLDGTIGREEFMELALKQAKIAVGAVTPDADARAK